MMCERKHVAPKSTNSVSGKPFIAKRQQEREAFIPVTQQKIYIGRTNADESWSPLMETNGLHKRGKKETAMVDS